MTDRRDLGPEPATPTAATPTTAAAPAPGPGSGIAGKRVVITGAAGGIGAALARRFAAEADVLVADREAEPLHGLAAELDAQARVVDLSDPDNAAELGEGADVVVNNAGFQHVAPIQEFSPDVFDTLLRVVVSASFRIVRSALPAMYERGWGRVINISSVHGLRASPFKSAYVAAKHGLEGLSKTIAVEGARHGVTANCICPGFVRTPLVERQISEQAVLHRVSEEEVLEDVLLERTPTKRLVEPEEVAELARWLCEPAANSVTGASLSMDGAWSAN
ncbi:3-hydroxybutyrate dehydrogenase [Bounagaea algeriensis]